MSWSSTRTSPSVTSYIRSRSLSIVDFPEREAFETARTDGYYEWPREATTRELAAELDVSKTTYLEHLRKAEAKLLNPSS